MNTDCSTGVCVLSLLVPQHRHYLFINMRWFGSKIISEEGNCCWSNFSFLSGQIETRHSCTPQICRGVNTLILWKGKFAAINQRITCGIEMLSRSEGRRIFPRIYPDEDIWLSVGSPSAWAIHSNEVSNIVKTRKTHWSVCSRGTVGCLAPRFFYCEPTSGGYGSYCP